MNIPFDAAMRQALALARAQNPAAATLTIQRALAGSGGERRRSDGGDAPPESCRGREKSAAGLVIDHDPQEPARSCAGGGIAMREGPGDAQRRTRRKRPLGEVIGMLASASALRQEFEGFPGVARKRREPVPEGARFLARKHACEAGSRSYKLYVPASVTDRPAGLLVMLHGCRQDPDDFAAGTRMNAFAETHRLVVAYPAQTGVANAASCWNWFDAAHQRRGEGEPAIISGITREVAAEFGVGRERTFAAGLSAGGAMAAVMGEAYPDLFAAIGVHSGLAVGSATDVVSAFAAMRDPRAVPPPAAGSLSAGTGEPVRTIVFHGTRDTTVHPSNADQVVLAAARDAGTLHYGKERFRENQREVVRTRAIDPSGIPRIEFWLVEGTGHAWSGGDPAGSYSDPHGPNATAEMIRFFLEKP